eukprot:7209112-Prymnesium_polylepis.1
MQLHFAIQLHLDLPVAATLALGYSCTWPCQSQQSSRSARASASCSCHSLTHHPNGHRERDHGAQRKGSTEKAAREWTSATRTMPLLIRAQSRHGKPLPGVERPRGPATSDICHQQSCAPCTWCVTAYMEPVTSRWRQTT